jgi:hypothetical protein
MSKALPAILTIGIGIATGGLGTAAAAVVGGGATFAQFATVAGAALSGIGAVTGKKDLMKIGGLVSLGAGLASGFGAAAGEGAGAISAGEFGGKAAESAPGAADATAALGGSGSSISSIGELGGSAAAGLEGSTLGALDATASGSGGMFSDAVSGGTGMAPAIKNPAFGQNVGASLAQPQEGGMLGMLNKVGANVRQNKELYSLGGQMLQGMFGPEAEAMDYRKAADERRRRNMNTIIPVGRLGG